MCSLKVAEVAIPKNTLMFIQFMHFQFPSFYKQLSTRNTLVSFHFMCDHHVTWHIFSARTIITFFTLKDHIVWMNSCVISQAVLLFATKFTLAAVKNVSTMLSFYVSLKVFIPPGLVVTNTTLESIGSMLWFFMNSETLLGGALIFANTAFKPLFLLVIELHVISQITLATCLELAVITRIRYPKMYGLVLFEIIFVREILSAVIATKDRPRQL